LQGVTVSDPTPAASSGPNQPETPAVSYFSIKQGIFNDIKFDNIVTNTEPSLCMKISIKLIITNQLSSTSINTKRKTALA